MKTLYETLLDDFDTLSSPLSSKAIKDGIKQFIKANYENPSKFSISRKPNEDGYYEVNDLNKNLVGYETASKTSKKNTNELIFEIQEILQNTTNTQLNKL